MECGFQWWLWEKVSLVPFVCLGHLGYHLPTTDVTSCQDVCFTSRPPASVIPSWFNICPGSLPLYWLRRRISPTKLPVLLLTAPFLCFPWRYPSQGLTKPNCLASVVRWDHILNGVSSRQEVVCKENTAHSTREKTKPAALKQANSLVCFLGSK